MLTTTNLTTTNMTTTTIPTRNADILFGPYGKINHSHVIPTIPTVPTAKGTHTTPNVIHTVPTVPTVPYLRYQVSTIPVIPPIQPLIKVKELELREWQVEWAHRANEILLRNYGYIDTSRMRSGKTYVTLWLAKQFCFRLLIVCPVIAIDVWKRTTAEYGVEVIDIISYQSLRSQKNHQPKHGLLQRIDNFTGKVNQVSFYPTKEYSELINNGIFVIFDEIQNIKNNSDQYKACSALIRPILAGGRSRFGLLSGTPFDKEDHAVNLLKLIGFIRSPRLYSFSEAHGGKELVLEGLQELIDACHFINSQETSKVLAEIPLKKGNMNTLCYTLYTRVIKANMSGAMASPTDITGTFNVANGFYHISPDRATELATALNDLASAVKFNEGTATAQIGADTIGEVTKALVRIENAKTLDWARVSAKALNDDPTLKVVISVNYTSTINELKYLLQIFDPLVLNGEIPANKRSPIVKMFNEDPSRRIILMNTAVGGIGISLYSPQTNSPRLMLLSPSYKLLDVTQAAARIYGPGMTSDATVHMFYGSGVGARETGILSALAKKTQVLKGTLEDEVTEELLLPGDYPSFEE